MAFPTLTTNTTDGSSAATNKVCNLPASISAGEGLIVLLRSAGADTHSLPSGWSWLVQNNTADGADDTVSIIYKQASGSEGASVTINGTASLKFVSLAWKVAGHRSFDAFAPSISTIATGTTSPVDPTAVTISETKDYLFLWVGCWDTETTSPPAGNPTNYASNIIAASSGTSGLPATNVRAASASRNLNTGSNEDPPSWAISGTANGWSAWAIAIHPVVVTTVTPSPATATAGVFAPKPNFTSNPSPAAAAFGVFAPTLVKGALLKTPTAVAAALAVAFAPTVTNVKTASPSPVAATWGVATPTLVKGAVTATPAPAAAAWGAVAPQLNRAQRPSAVAASFAVAAPASSLAQLPSAAAAAWGVPAPTLVTGGTTPIKVSASAYIAASGEATTAQLDPPAGKTTGDFTAGRIQDDENPADAVDVGAGKYTELEWALKADVGTVAGRTFEFRVTIGGTPITSYAQTPRLTIPATPSPATAAWSVATPAIVKGAVTATPAPAAATWAVATPAIVKGAVAATPSPATAAWSVATPSIVKGAVAATPSAAAATWAVATPAILAGGTLGPTPVAATFAVAPPTVVRGALTLAPSAAAAAWTAPAPTVTNAKTVGPQPTVAAFAVNAPTVVRGALTLAPSAVTAAWTAPTPTIVQGRVVAPDAVAAAWAAPAPTVSRGGVTAAPAPATAAWGVAAPAVQNVRALSPAPTAAAWGVAAPAVQYVMVVRPAPATAAWGVGNVVLVGPVLTIAYWLDERTEGVATSSDVSVDADACTASPGSGVLDQANDRTIDLGDTLRNTAPTLHHRVLDASGVLDLD